MKKILLSLCIPVLSLSSLWAQEAPAYQRFEFSHSTAAYTPLSSSAVELEFPDSPEDEDFEGTTFTLSFPFKFQNVDVTTVKIDTYGGLVFNDIYVEEVETRVLGLYLGYKATEERGRLLYEVTGTEGNRILKIEFNNVATEIGVEGGTDTVNFQMWLYENTNVIETHVGYSNLPEAFFAQTLEDYMDEEDEKGALFSAIMSNEGDVMEENLEDVYFHYVRNTGSGYESVLQSGSLIASPSMETILFIMDMNQRKMPEEGTVFRYTPFSSTSVEKMDMGSVKVFPNPAHDVLNIELLDGQLIDASYTVYDIYGREIMKERMDNPAVSVQIGHMTPGQYFLRMNNAGKEAFIQFVKN